MAESRLFFQRAAVALVIVLVVHTGCTDLPARLGWGQPSSLFVSPTTVQAAPGDTIRPSALAVRSGPYTDTVTGHADWSSSDTAVAAVDRQGQTVQIVARNPGTASVGAAMDGVTGALSVHVEDGATRTPGPLTVSTENPRYFAEPSGEIVYLSGSHTWGNFQDFDFGDGFVPFDYSRFLDFLSRHNHNFTRLWTWEQAAFTPWMKGEFRYSPVLYRRTGPGDALDGQARFDLSTFNDAYFQRLRKRVEAARRRGIYVAVILFNGWSIEDKDRGGGNPWRGHPYNAANNVNGIDGDLDDDGEGEEIHTLENPEVTDLQEAYVRRVVETLEDFDNVLYEISNESHGRSDAWQEHMVSVVQQVESDLSSRHPVGLTVRYPGGDNPWLFRSDADWVAPNREGGYLNDPPAADGTKVIISDTDHYGTDATTTGWVWKTFLRGMNPTFMDAYDGSSTGTNFKPDFDPQSPRWVGVRLSMGQTRVVASRLPLTSMAPRPDLCSSGYCMAGKEGIGSHLVAYFPDDAETPWIDLSSTSRNYAVQWFRPAVGDVRRLPDVEGGHMVRLDPPFGGDAVLHLRPRGDEFEGQYPTELR